MTTMTTAAGPRTASGSDFAELNRRINAAGLLRRRPAYYAVRLGLVGAALVAGWSAFFVIGASWWTLAVAAFLAVVFAQVALVAHDLAHRQVFRTNRPSARAGLVAGNLAIGMSYGYWMAKHTKHHANPNHDDLDPDVGPGVLVWSRDAARGRGFLTRYQAYFFLPLLTLLGISLKRDSIRAIREGTVKRRGLEGGLLAAHFVLYLSALFTVLVAAAGGRLHRGAPGALRCLPGAHLRAQPQGHAASRRHRGLPAQAGADLAQRARWLAGRHGAGRAQPPDRAPPLPGHADAQPAQGAADRPRPTAPRSASPTR